MVFQDPYSSLSPRLPVGEIIGEAVREHNLVPKEEFDDYIDEVMQECGLQPFHKDRYPHEFSGGQRQRICIARALALKPEFIVCDEPVSALDVSIQAQIINLLNELQEKRGLTYLFISHDLSVVEHISDTVGVMYLGGLVETGVTDDIFSNPLHPYTKALFSAIPMPDPDLKQNRIMLEGDIPSPANPPAGCKFHTRCKECMEICKTVVPEARDMGGGHIVSCHLYDDAAGGNDKAYTSVAEKSETAMPDEDSVAAKSNADETSLRDNDNKCVPKTAECESEKVFKEARRKRKWLYVECALVMVIALFLMFNK